MFGIARQSDARLALMSDRFHVFTVQGIGCARLPRQTRSRGGPTRPAADRQRDHELLFQLRPVLAGQPIDQRASREPTRRYELAINHRRTVDHADVLATHGSAEIALLAAALRPFFLPEVSGR